MAEKGLLLFQRRDETQGSLHRVNYLGLLEQVAEFDPFVKEHTGKARPGGGRGGKPSYRSSKDLLRINLNNGQENKELHSSWNPKSIKHF